jgi:hypothetical protein
MEETTAEATDSLSKDTGGIVGLEGPLDSLDLTNILVKELGEQEQQSEEPSPSGDAVEEVEAVEESTEETTETEHDLSQEESETESKEESSPGDEPEWMQRRIDRFTRKLRLAEEERDELDKEVNSLRARLEEQPATVQQDGNPVATVTSQRELNEIANLSEKRLQFAEDMEDALLDQPERVEQILRDQGVTLTDNEGDDDFSPARMTRFIRQVRRDSTNKLNRWIPQRQAELGQAKEFNTQAEKLYPWLKNEDSKEMQIFQQVLNQTPQAQYAPNHKLELARYVRGYMMELADQGKAKITPKKVSPEPGKPKSAPAPKEGKLAKYEDAKNRVFANQDRRGLVDLVGTIIE